MKTRSIIIASLALALALALPSCSGAAPEGSGSEPPASGSKRTYEQIKASGELRIGTEGTYAPFSYHDETGLLTGYDIEIALAVSEVLGLKPIFVEAPWDSMVASFDADKCDTVFNQMAVTDARKEKYAFSEPYTYSRAVLIVNTANTEITKFEDLAGKHSAQSTNSNYAQFAESYGATVDGVDGFSKAAQLVAESRSDAAINDDLAYYDFMTQKPESPLKIVAEMEEPIVMASPVKIGNEDLLADINSALAQLSSNGKLTEISTKYFGKDVSKP
ncbi:MAG: transporter substrate-binding domain-containing protein [Eubacteriaceae bacterium]|nr:transporter substrate-binding domain-containing protein [Eubacteriaceae bacterium]